ncbi:MULTISPECIES: hypothetical protein [Desulfococcus]|uniref:hypothetical protein n=1 Tax=Desulfococcus TaxID=896 RepID=UPI0003FB9FD9|nr:hypothetical protein [Desulfococcus multivorans]AOY59084.1 conserved uncharacterized protein [Desulfococcus multivorans]AQV01330.1 hypothetical protein B2D07_11545 [Desulfococcus multivorans]MDX9817377.1 hypothetical protein [Desulfococcus multivorans]
MIRLLIISALVYFLYRKIRSWAGRLDDSRTSVAAVEDIMVQDPYCETYFPKREGVPLDLDGKKLLFCSRKCRDAFVAEHSRSSTGG